MNNKLELAKELYMDSRQPVLFFDGNADLLWKNASASFLVETSNIHQLNQICITSNLSVVMEKLSAGEGCQVPGNPIVGLGGVMLTPCFSNDKLDFIIALVTAFSKDSEKSDMQEIISTVVGQYSEQIFAIHNMLGPLKNRLEQYECYNDCNYLKSISQSCYKTMRFTSNISSYFRYMDPQVKMDLQVLDINSCITEICYFIDRFVLRSGIEFEYEPCEETIISKIDLKKLSIAILNLIANACLYTAPGNKITVKLAKIQNDFVITVSDKGIGMSADVQHHAFDPFYSYDPNDTPASGVGLGLTLVKQVAELHGGTCMLTSELEVGTTVAIRIPIAEGEAETAVEAPDNDLFFSKFSPPNLYLVDICDISMIDSL